MSQRLLETDFPSSYNQPQPQVIERVKWSETDFLIMWFLDHLLKCWIISISNQRNVGCCQLMLKETIGNWARHNKWRICALLSCPCYFSESADGYLPRVGVIISSTMYTKILKTLENVKGRTYRTILALKCRKRKFRQKTFLLKIYSFGLGTPFFKVKKKFEFVCETKVAAFAS